MVVVQLCNNVTTIDLCDRVALAFPSLHVTHPGCPPVLAQITRKYINAPAGQFDTKVPAGANDEGGCCMWCPSSCPRAL